MAHLFGLLSNDALFSGESVNEALRLLRPDSMPCGNLER